MHSVSHKDLTTCAEEMAEAKLPLCSVTTHLSLSCEPKKGTISPTPSFNLCFWVWQTTAKPQAVIKIRSRGQNSDPGCLASGSITSVLVVPMSPTLAAHRYNFVDVKCFHSLRHDAFLHFLNPLDFLLKKPIEEIPLSSVLWRSDCSSVEYSLLTLSSSKFIVSCRILFSSG